MASVTPMQRSRKLNFYDCIQPLFAVSRALGLSTFRIDINSNGTPERANFSAFRFIGSIVLNLMLAFFIQYLTRNRIPFETPILILANFAYRTFIQLNVFSSIFCDMFNRNRMVAILQDIITFDENVTFFCSL